MTVQIKSLEQLKRESDKGAEFFILLGKSGVLKSSKWIEWDSDENKFLIINYVDNCEQELTENQLMDKEYTNIGYAITKGALYLDD